MIWITLYYDKGKGTAALAEVCALSVPACPCVTEVIVVIAKIEFL